MSLAVLSPKPSNVAEVWRSTGEAGPSQRKAWSFFWVSSLTTGACPTSWFISLSALALVRRVVSGFVAGAT
jgi:hypothetical protein